jgi:hypothetical protein
VSGAAIAVRRREHLDLLDRVVFIRVDGEWHEIVPGTLSLSATWNDGPGFSATLARPVTLSEHDLVLKPGAIIGGPYKSLTNVITPPDEDGKGGSDAG